MPHVCTEFGEILYMFNKFIMGMAKVFHCLPIGVPVNARSLKPQIGMISCIATFKIERVYKIEKKYLDNFYVEM